MIQFPDDFLWGAASAAHQVEGGNTNSDCWLLEWAENSLYSEPSGDACDHYHRYREDIATLAALGLNTYRFTIEWARIEPEEGYFSIAALEHYRRMIATCWEHDVTPVVSYNHFSLPRWFAGAGGWNDAAAPDRFARYAERATAHLGDLIPWACTLNEPNCWTMTATVGLYPAAYGNWFDFTSAAKRGGYDPAKFQPYASVVSVENYATAHRKAVEAIKSGPGDISVGWTLALVDLQPVEGGEELCERAIQRSSLDWLDVSRDDDFVGVQTYSRERVGADGVIPPPVEVPKNQMGWEIYSDALEHTVRLAASRAGVPVLITENGLATEDDEARIAHTRRVLQGVGRCIADGVDVRGYLHWTLLDNFEWMAGYAMTFGLISVDRKTMTRTVKPSARWLGEIARSNRL